MSHQRNNESNTNETDFLHNENLNPDDFEKTETANVTSKTNTTSKTNATTKTNQDKNNKNWNDNGTR